MKNRAFTLIELLVVISIISLLSSVVLASLNSARDKGRLAAGKQFDANMYHAEADQAVGVWDFDECSGTTANDRSGNGNNGTLVGSPAWSTDTPSGTGCSLSFNGTTQYVSIGNAPSLNVGSLFTVSAWVKVVSAPFTWNFILAGPTGDIGVGINPNLGASIMLTKINIHDAPASSAGMSLNAWHHVAVVFSNNTAYYYTDGASVGKVADSDTFTAGSKFIGVNGTSGGFFTGLLDGVRLYAKDLTASEVGKLYASEKARFMAQK